MDKLIKTYTEKIDNLLTQIGCAELNTLPADSFMDINILTERLNNYNEFEAALRERQKEIESEEPANEYSLEMAFKYIPQAYHDEVKAELMRIIGITNYAHLTRIIKGDVSPRYNIGKQIEHYINIRFPTIRKVWQSKPIKQ